VWGSLFRLRQRFASLFQDVVQVLAAAGSGSVLSPTLEEPLQHAQTPGESHSFSEPFQRLGTAGHRGSDSNRVGFPSAPDKCDPDLLPWGEFSVAVNAWSSWLGGLGEKCDIPPIGILGQTQPGREDSTFDCSSRVVTVPACEVSGIMPGKGGQLTYLPPPWGECRSSDVGLDFFPVYSITACRIDCETRYIVENCNCKMVHMPGDAPFCTPEQYKECAEPALGLLAEKDSNYCICRMPCNLTRYNKELSMVKIPSKTSAKYLEKKFNKSEKYISENILVLDIFFEALNYETIEQKKAYEVAALLGDIGGQMGLFIGASILTILELFDYIYELIKERLLDLLGKEEEEGSHDENVSTCDPMPNHSETISHTVNVPLQTTLGTLEEIAC
ncbi:acid-sensing ion channel 2-like, partial [Macrochelys suwanniensis]